MRQDGLDHLKDLVLKFFQLVLILVPTACTPANSSYCPNHSCPGAAKAGSTVRVSLSGNDAADGVTAPVKTLKHAIELAKANAAINVIHLDAGKYGAANGETYPYAVPTGATIVGEQGTILAGTTKEAGLVVDTGTLENLELEHFTTAIHVTGAATMKGISVKLLKVGVLSDGTAKLTARALTFIGTPDCSTTGLRVSGSSQVTVDTMAATDAISVDQTDQTAVAIANGTAKTKGGDCVHIRTAGKSLVVTDTTLTGGGAGVDFESADNGLDVTLTNTTIADTAFSGIIGSAKTMQMTGGEIRNNDTGAELNSGSYTFTNVAIKGNHSLGISLVKGTRGGALSPGSLRMRRCTVTGNTRGVYLLGATGDLGTPSDPGNNTFGQNLEVGLDLYESVATFAVGNTWRPNVQGADAHGKYASGRIKPPVDAINGHNYRIKDGSPLTL